MKRKTILTYGTLVLGLGLAGYLLGNIFSEYTWADIVQSVSDIPAGNLAAAGGFCAASYLCLTGFDWAGVRYVNGPLNVALTYDQLNPANQLGNDATPKSWNVGASYDFEVVKLAAAFGQTRDGWFTGQSINAFGSTETIADGFRSNVGVEDFKANSYMVGLTVPLGASSILASWQRADPDSDLLTGGDSAMNVYSIGYTYNLSKRTNVYALGSYATDFAFIDGVKSTVGMVGIRHRF